MFVDVPIALLLLINDDEDSDGLDEENDVVNEGKPVADDDE